MVTRDDVAREAGTSPAVVSYVVNDGPRRVAESTRQRVLAAIDALGYRPNAVARALRSSTSRAIGLIVPDITNPFFAELAQAVETAAFTTGHTLFVGNAMHRDDLQARYVDAFLEHQVRGIVFINASTPSTEDADGSLRSLQRSAVPTVFLDRVTPEADGATILVDNRGGAERATRHLLEHGHRSVLVFAGPDDVSSVAERTAGWTDAITAAGLDPADQPRCVTAFDRYAAFRAATALFADRPPRAMFVHSDEQALGILQAATAAGLSVPDDVAIVSFDGIRESGICTPGLTTVEQPIRDMARAAIERISTVPDPRVPSETVVLPTRLVIRASCGCPAAPSAQAPAS